MRLGQAEECSRRALASQPHLVDDEALAAIEGIAALGVLELLDELPPEQRDAIVARYIEGCGYDEIAATLGSPESAVRKRVSRD